jgi:hypothetical protein
MRNEGPEPLSMRVPALLVASRFRPFTRSRGLSRRRSQVRVPSLTPTRSPEAEHHERAQVHGGDQPHPPTPLYESKSRKGMRWRPLG